MKICIASVALSLFFGASASAKGWNSRVLSIHENVDDGRRSLRGNKAEDNSFLEREEENLLMEEEALLESILEEGRSEEGNSRRNHNNRNNDDDDDNDKDRNNDDRNNDDDDDNGNNDDRSNDDRNNDDDDDDDNGDNDDRSNDDRNNDDDDDDDNGNNDDRSNDDRRNDDDDDNNYLGCYRDGANNRNLEGKVNTNGFLTVNSCIKKCDDQLKKFAGVAKSGGECWCGDRNNNRKANNSRDCASISSHGGYAGGAEVISVYRV